MSSLAILYVDPLEGRLRFRLQRPDEPIDAAFDEYFSQTVTAELLSGLAASAHRLLASGEDAAFRERARSLGQTLFRSLVPRGVAERLSRVEGPLLIASSMHGLPWELLHDGAEFWGLRYAVGRYLLAERRRPTARGDRPRGARLRALIVGSDPSGDLPFVGSEVDEVAGLLERVADVRCASGRAAVLDVVAGYLASGFDLVHFCGHIEVRPGSEPAFLLADGQRLTASLLERNLRGEPLVFLNGCASTRASEARPEPDWEASVTNLTQSVIFAGALGAVGTLSPVGDRHAALLAACFYRRVVTGEAFGEALRIARLECSRDPHGAGSPTWLSLALYGNPTLGLREGQGDVAGAAATGTAAVVVESAALPAPPVERPRRRALWVASGLAVAAIVTLLSGYWPHVRDIAPPLPRQETPGGSAAGGALTVAPPARPAAPSAAPPAVRAHRPQDLRSAWVKELNPTAHDAGGYLADWARARTFVASRRTAVITLQTSGGDLRERTVSMLQRADRRGGERWLVRLSRGTVPVGPTLVLWVKNGRVADGRAIFGDVGVTGSTGDLPLTPDVRLEDLLLVDQFPLLPETVRGEFHEEAVVRAGQPATLVEFRHLAELPYRLITLWFQGSPLPTAIRLARADAVDHSSVALTLEDPREVSGSLFPFTMEAKRSNSHTRTTIRLQSVDLTGESDDPLFDVLDEDTVHHGKSRGLSKFGCPLLDAIWELRRGCVLAVLAADSPWRTAIHPRLAGSARDDVLVGKAAGDLLEGGEGHDWFVFTDDVGRFDYVHASFSKPGTLSADRIRDFEPGKDKIGLQRGIFAALSSAPGEGFATRSDVDLEPSGEPASSAAAIVYEPSTGTLYYNENRAAAGFGAGGPFAKLDTKPTLQASDFVILGPDWEPWEPPR